MSRIDKQSVFSHNSVGVIILKRNILKLILLGVAVMLLFTSCVKDPGTVDPPAETEVPGEEYVDDNFEFSIYPKPLAAVVSEDESLAADASLLTPSDRSFDNMFVHFGFKVGTGGLPVEIKLDSAMAEEEYSLVSTKESVTLTASGERGVYTALSTLAQIRKNGKIAAAEISDKPSVPLRGVIEGFYGVAWTHEYRLDLFKFMGKYKLNAYIYAPKDDPKHRSEWRSLYTEEELAKMTELVDCARENNVRFIYAISPGLDIKLGTGYEKDLQKLFDKCQSMYDIGVRDFALLLDDITTLDAEGHAKLLNDFQNDFVKTHEGCADLIMISPEFCDAMITKYSRDLAPLLQADLKVMWTGEGVIPANITDKTLRKATKLYERQLFIWWNYPVNDTMANNLFMGPCEGLGGNIDEAINGLVSNPMNQGYASMLPLLTISDFLWNPAGYDKETSLSEAANKLAPACSEGLLALADLCRASVMNGNTSSLYLKEAISSFTPGDSERADALLSKLESTKAALAEFREKGSRQLVSEVKKWLDKAENLINASIEYIHFEAASDEASKEEHALAFVSLYKKATSSTAIVSPDLLVPFLENARKSVNGILGVSETPVSSPSVSTNMPVYLDYVPENAVDGNGSTFFWSNGAPGNGSTFTYDLGNVTEVKGVKISMGVSGHTDDYIRKGVVEYSTDGSSYTKLCDIGGRNTSDSTVFTARYVRIRCTASQTNWATISEFKVTRDMDLPDGVTFSGNANADLSPLFDGSLFTEVSYVGTGLSGQIITIDASGRTGAAIYFNATGKVKVTVTDESGDTLQPELSGVCVRIDLTGKKTLEITLGGQFSIAEIVIS